MSDFVFDTTPTSPADPAPEAVVTNDGWFTDIDPVAIRKDFRIREAVTPERLRGAIVRAIMTVNRQLTAFRAGHSAAGHSSLADVPAPEIDGKSEFVQLYSAAIGAAAKVELVERYRDIDLTGAGQRQVDEMDSAISELRRDMIHAVRDLLGEGRTVVELI
ncbi:head completion/stabilization protein [Sphingomonas sp.]|uniref:head completion/stabilization protein n=1 Tax=Sphingomonas sp. TaxID=28214 RepID=UPI002EDABF85